MTDSLDARLIDIAATGAEVYVANVTDRPTRARQFVAQITRPGQPPRVGFGPTPSAALAAAESPDGGDGR